MTATELARPAPELKLSRRAATALLWLLLLAAGTISVFQSVSKPFWFDEVSTVDLCRLPNAQIWAALNDAVDGNPPVFYWIAKAGRRFIPDDHLGYRLASILGFLAALFFVHRILLKRVDAIAALAGAVFLLCTILPEYASQARPYGLLLGCVSAAIFAWQRIDDSLFYPFLFALALAGSLSVHYYAVLVWPAFVAAEAAIMYFRRRVRIGVWLALLIGAAPLLFFLKLALRFRQYYGTSFWAQPKLTHIVTDYDVLFSLNPFWGWIFVAGATTVLGYWMFLQLTGRGRAHTQIGGNRIPIEESILAIAFLWLSPMGIVAARFAHGGMTARYTMPTILGGALIVGYLAGKLHGLLKGLLVALMLMNYAIGSTPDLVSALHRNLLAQRAAAREMPAIANRFSEGTLPIVISSGIEYLSASYYAPPATARNLYAIIDPKSALKLRESDSVDLDLAQMRRYFPIQVEEYDRFAAEHKEFLLVSDGSLFDWWPERLAHDGNELQLLSKSGASRVYKVTLRR